MSRPRVYEEDRVAAAFRLPRSLHDSLKLAAYERDVSANFLVIRALSDYLDHPVRKRYLAEVLEPIERERIEVDVPEDAHHDRPASATRGWQWEGTRASASAAAAALRWEEQHPDS